MVEFRFTGALTPRIDGSGNLGIFDQNGNEVETFIGGILSGKVNKGTPGSNTPISTTASLGLVHSGRYVQITPQVSGSVLVYSNLYGDNNTAGDGITVGLLYKSGAQTPAGGASTAGWTSANSNQFTSSANNQIGNLTLIGIITGLTNGTVYTFAVGFEAVTGGTAQLFFGTNLTDTVMAVEL